MKDGATEAQFEQDRRECLYEGTKATQVADPSLGPLGGEIDRANRRVSVAQECLEVRGYRRAPKSAP
jgi:hypothetical protein